MGFLGFEVYLEEERKEVCCSWVCWLLKNPQPFALKGEQRVMSTLLQGHLLSVEGSGPWSEGLGFRVLGLGFRGGFLGHFGL